MNNRPIVKKYSNEFQTQVVDLILHIQQQEYNIPFFMINHFYSREIHSGNVFHKAYEEQFNSDTQPKCLS